MEFPVIIVECTFFGIDDEVERAHKIGHMTWKELRPIIESARDDQRFVLIHFSLRYSKQEIIDYFKKDIGGDSKLAQKVVLFVGEYFSGHDP